MKGERDEDRMDEATARPPRKAENDGEGLNEKNGEGHPRRRRRKLPVGQMLLRVLLAAVGAVVLFYLVLLITAWT